MKKILMMFALVLTLLFSTIDAAASNNVSYDKYESVDSVHVSVPSTIRLVDGDKFDIQIFTSDTVIKDYIIYEIKDNVLYIKTKKFIDEFDMQNVTHDDIRIRIVSPKNLGIGVRRHYTLRTNLTKTSGIKKDDSGNSTI